MRLVLIHGLGEDNSIFDAIALDLPGDHLFINLWEALGDGKRPRLNIIDFCKELVERYSIDKNDIIIGHSLGGRIAHHIKHVNGNKVIQIASWTTQGKASFPMKSRRLGYFFIRLGFLGIKSVKRYMMKKYRHDYSKKYYEQALDNLINGNRNCVVNQFRLAFDPARENVTESPDLRIHAKKDYIVRYPNETFDEVSGDHFSLLTHPAEVVKSIKSFLTTI